MFAILKYSVIVIFLLKVLKIIKKIIFLLLFQFTQEWQNFLKKIIVKMFVLEKNLNFFRQSKFYSMER